MTKDQKLEVRVDKVLKNLTDFGADLLNTDRSKLIRDAIRDYVKSSIRENEHSKEQLIEDYLSGDIDYSVLHEILDHEDARAIRASKEMYSQMDKTIDDLAAEL